MITLKPWVHQKESLGLRKGHVAQDADIWSVEALRPGVWARPTFGYLGGSLG